MKTSTYNETEWKLVPVEPTEEMVNAFKSADLTELRRYGVTISRLLVRFTQNYRAMLAAAPTPPVSEDRKERETHLYLAEQNEKQKDALLYVMRATCLSADDNPDSPIGMLYKRASNAYELHDLASPVLNRIRAEGMEMAAKWFNDHVDNRTDTWQAQELRRMAAELRNTNG